MILLVVLVLAWLAILGPGLLKRWAGHGDGISSVSHFHHQLRVLEHSGTTPIVRPAYRLKGVQPSMQGMHFPDVASVPVLTVVGADKLPRPALAWLADDREEGGAHSGHPSRPAAGSEDGAQADRRRGQTFESVGSQDRRSPWADQPFSGRTSDHSATTVARPMTVEARRLARRRRRSILTLLVSVFALTLLIGCIPGASAAWIVTLIAGLASGAYVALLVYLRAMAEENERTLRYLSSATHPAHGRGAAEGSEREEAVGDWWEHDRVEGDQHAPARRTAAR